MEEVTKLACINVLPDVSSVILDATDGGRYSVNFGKSKYFASSNKRTDLLMLI